MTATCTGCGTQDPDWLYPADQGYSACCNEPIDDDPGIGCCGEPLSDKPAEVTR